MAWRRPAAEVTIAAPLRDVWATLLDGSRYPEWNPLILEEEGDSLQVGAPVRMKVRLGRFTVRPTRATTRIVLPGEAPDGKAEWVHRFASRTARLGLICSQRHHELTAAGASGTRYVTFEDFWGPLSVLLPYGVLEAGFEAQSRALKERCESHVVPGSSSSES